MGYINKKYGTEVFKDNDCLINVYMHDSKFFPGSNYHSHNYFQMCYVLKGKIKHLIGESSQILTRGDVFCVAPEIGHSVYKVDNREVQFIQWEFMPSFIDENFTVPSGKTDVLNFAYIQAFLLSQSSYCPKLILCEITKSIIENLVSSMLNEYICKKEGYKLCLKADLIKILVLLSREYKYAYQNDNKFNKLLINYKDCIFKAIQFINENYMTDINLTLVCEHALMSQAYFSFLFKQLTNMTFVQYLTDLRIGKAMDLLRKTENIITDIAIQVGYNDISHFNKVFKKTVGVPPTIYRKAQYFNIT